MQLEYLSGLQMGELVNKGELSPVEIIRYFADRIEKRNPSITAFVYTKIDDALEEAKKLEKRIASGEYVGPFAGVPVGLKDFLPSKKGWTNSHGGVEKLIRVDDGDSMFYTAARELGAIAIGKTNAPPFGFKGTCDNTMYGPTHNPFNTEYNSGGSSGGTAAAVADGLIPMGEGGDAGGSIRIPSAWCNCFGFKSSLGTVPSYCRPDGWTATHPYCFNGAITRTVVDSATMLNSMARYNPRDPISLPINANKDFTELMKKPIKDWKIGFTTNFNLFPVDPEIADIVKKAAMKFEEAGAHVEPVKFNFKHSLDEFAKTWCWSISLDTYLDMYYWKQNEGFDLPNEYSHQLTPEFIKWNGYARAVDIFDFRFFNEIRTDILDAFEDAFEKYDIIISPVSSCAPIKNGEAGPSEIGGVKINPEHNFISFAQTFLVNFIGYPAASVPAGFTANSLPVGMHIIGKQYRDEDVFAMSYTFEQIQPWSYDAAYTRII